MTVVKEFFLIKNKIVSEVVVTVPLISVAVVETMISVTFRASRKTLKKLKRHKKV